MADENEMLPDDEVLEIRTDTGAVFKGTKDEIIADMKKSVENGSTTLRQYKETNEQLTRVVESLQTPEPEPTTSNAFDNKKYFKLLAEDPMSAADYMDEFRYGESREQMMGRLNVAHQRAVEVGGLLEIQKFKNMVGPEYPGTPEVSELIWKHGDFDHNPATAAEMLKTYTELKQAGKIKPGVVIAEEAEKPSPRRAPPSARGTGAGDRMTATDAQRYQKMTPDQIKAEMEKIRHTHVQ